MNNTEGDFVPQVEEALLLLAAGMRRGGVKNEILLLIDDDNVVRPEAEVKKTEIEVIRKLLPVFVWKPVLILQSRLISSLDTDERHELFDKRLEIHIVFLEFVRANVETDVIVDLISNFRRPGEPKPFTLRSPKVDFKE